MPQTIFLTIIKWWCNCLDLCFEILAHPWKPEELHYRRMICTIFGQSYKLKKSFSWFCDPNNLPKTYKATREMLVQNTRIFWSLSQIRREMTPKWPEGAVDYLKEVFDDLLSSGPVSPTTAQAFRLMHEVGDKYVPEKLLAEKLGVDKNQLFNELDHLEWRLCSSQYSRILHPFAFQNQYTLAGSVVNEWRKNKWKAVDTNVASAIENRTVEELELSVRSYNCLKNNNIQTVGEILRKTEAEMLEFKNFGRKSLNEISELLSTIHPLLKIGMLAPKQEAETEC